MVKYIILNGEIYVETLAMVELQKKHTAVNLRKEIIRVLERYGIDLDQIYNNTTDNGHHIHGHNGPYD